jgi:hypothetical protein
MLAMGYKVGFIFQDIGKFEKQLGEIRDPTRCDQRFLKHIKLQQDTSQNKLSDIRNRVVEHVQVPADAAHVIYQPSMAKEYFDLCWQTSEWLTAILMAQHLPASLELVNLSLELMDNERRPSSSSSKRR